MEYAVRVSREELAEAIAAASIAEAAAWRAAGVLWDAQSGGDDLAVLCAESTLTGARAAEQQAQQRLRGLQWRQDVFAAREEAQRLREEKRRREQRELADRVVAAVLAADSPPLQQRDLADILGVPIAKLSALEIADPRVEHRRSGDAADRGWWPCPAV